VLNAAIPPSTARIPISQAGLAKGRSQPQRQAQLRGADRRDRTHCAASAGVPPVLISPVHYLKLPDTGHNEAVMERKALRTRHPRGSATS